jgi:hypothetical protein
LTNLILATSAPLIIYERENFIFAKNFFVSSPISRLFLTILKNDFSVHINEIKMLLAISIVKGKQETNRQTMA